MPSPFEHLDTYLQATGSDGFLIEADSSVSDQFYLSGFDAPDPFITLYVDGEIHLLVTGLEYTRAKQESRATTVSQNEEYGGEGRIRQFGSDENSAVLASFLEEYGVSTVAVPSWFPTGTADGLRKHGLDVVPETEGLLTEMRAVKTDTEIAHIERAQRAAEAAVERVETLLEEATVDDGVLVYDGETLTSETVRSELEITLLREGATHAGHRAVVACGADAADPHKVGSGPLRADETILVDVFPRDSASRYHGDISRTFLKGSASEALRGRYELTNRALEAALETIEPGIEAESVHDAACAVYEEAGYPTLRTDPQARTGFIHRTGHGIGLDVHENPRLSSKGGTLEAGHVVTVEPGLYDPAVGGIRIEDLVVVTEDGHENLTDYEKSLVL